LHPLHKGTDVCDRPLAVRAAGDEGFDPAFAQIAANSADVDYLELLDSPPPLTRCPHVGANHGAIDAAIAGISIILARVTKMIFPWAGLATTPEPPVGCVPLAVLLRHVVPASTATRLLRSIAESRLVRDRMPSATMHQ
jgi:hypothetical protein